MLKIISALVCLLFASSITLATTAKPPKLMLNAVCKINQQCMSGFCSNGFCAEAPDNEDLSKFKSVKSLADLKQQYPNTKFRKIGPDQYESLTTVNGKRIVVKIVAKK